MLPLVYGLKKSLHLLHRVQTDIVSEYLSQARYFLYNKLPYLNTDGYFLRMSALYFKFYHENKN